MAAFLSKLPSIHSQTLACPSALTDFERKSAATNAS
jgi:hypothetical protein